MHPARGRLRAGSATTPFDGPHRVRFSGRAPAHNGNGGQAGTGRAGPGCGIAATVLSGVKAGCYADRRRGGGLARGPAGGQLLRGAGNRVLPRQRLVTGGTRAGYDGVNTPSAVGAREPFTPSRTARGGRR